MLSIFSSIFGGGLGGIQSLVSTIFGNKGKRELYAAEEQTALQRGFEAEFSYRANRTWWDSLVDGLNRLPRPIMTVGIIALFVWAMMDTVGFTAAMYSLYAIPEALWYIFYTIIGFWFGTKMLENAPRRMKGLSPEELRGLQALIQQTQSPKLLTNEEWLEKHGQEIKRESDPH